MRLAILLSGRGSNFLAIHDAIAGRTLDGPHLTDLQVVYAPKNMPARDASTGEQKALLIGLVLAHAALVSEADFTAWIADQESTQASHGAPSGALSAFVVRDLIVQRSTIFQEG